MNYYPKQKVGQKKISVISLSFVQSEYEQRGGTMEVLTLSVIKENNLKIEINLIAVTEIL